MDWANERYVRLFTRDTATWKLFDWQARFVLMSMIRKVDRSGVLDIGDAGLPGLAAVLEVPIEIVKSGIAQLERQKTAICRGSAYVLPKFLAAQETPTSNTERQRQSRERRRDEHLGGTPSNNNDDLDNPPWSHGVTHGHATSHDVTRGHTRSQSVTPSVPSYPSVHPSIPSDPPKSTRGKRAARVEKPDDPPVEGWQNVIDAFSTAYREVNGKKASWSTPAARRAMRSLRGIVREHGAPEVIRRIELVHATPPAFPPGPWTIDMFVSHFDRLVAVERNGRRGPVNHAQVAVDAQISRAENFKRLAGLPHEYDGDRPNECRLCGGPRDAELHMEDTPPYERAEGASGQHDDEDDVPWA